MKDEGAINSFIVPSKFDVHTVLHSHDDDSVRKCTSLTFALIFLVFPSSAKHLSPPRPDGHNQGFSQMSKGRGESS